MLTTDQHEDVLALVDAVVCLFSGQPDDVGVALKDGEKNSFQEIRPTPQDAGSLIGRDGCVIKALQTIFGAYSARVGHRIHVCLIQPVVTS